MGKYVTTTSINLILPHFLKGNTTSSDTVGTDIFSRQIDNAESLVNASIVSRYNITGFTSTAIPPLLRQITEKLAIYNVMMITGYAADKRNEYTDDYKQAKTTLTEIKEGTTKLTFTDGSVVAGLGSSRYLSDKTGFTPIFGMDDESNWKRDNDEIDAQNNARD